MYKTKGEKNWAHRKLNLYLSQCSLTNLTNREIEKTLNVALTINKQTKKTQTNR